MEELERASVYMCMEVGLFQTHNPSRFQYKILYIFSLYQLKIGRYITGLF